MEVLRFWFTCILMYVYVGTYMIVCQSMNEVQYSFSPFPGSAYEYEEDQFRPHTPFFLDEDDERSNNHSPIT